jgi:hypothetical protein
MRPQRPIVAVLAICAFAYGVYMLLSVWSFMRTAHTVQGLIVDRDNAHFTVEYMVNGRALQLTESLPSTKGFSGMSRRKLRPGNSVPVLYDPALPSRAKWDSNRIWVFPAAIMFMASLVLCAALFPNAMGTAMSSPGW